MNKILAALRVLLAEFIKNDFWRSWPNLAILAVSVLLNVALWVIFALKIKQNPVPFIYASGLVLVNLFLGNYIYSREKLISLFLIIATLFVQILMLIFVRYLTLTF